jgi:hypothetical protein
MAELASLELDKNIDRINAYKDHWIVSSYHLDKETGLKTGNLVSVRVTDSLKLDCQLNESFDFGILSTTVEGDKITLACSDGGLRLDSKVIY